MKGILALDAATTTGWAFASPRAINAWPEAMMYAQPLRPSGFHSGHHLTGPEGDMGAVCHGLENLLAWLKLKRGVPAIVARETPFVHPKHGATNNTQVLYGLGGVIAAWAYGQETHPRNRQACWR